MPIPDNEIDYSICFGRGAERQEREREDTRRHAKHNRSEPIRRERLKTERSKTRELETDDDHNTPERTIRDTKSLTKLLALKYPTFKEAYEHHEDEIGTFVTNTTVANIHRDTRHTLKLFTQIGIIDQAALKRFMRRNRK